MMIEDDRVQAARAGRFERRPVRRAAVAYHDERAAIPGEGVNVARAEAVAALALGHAGPRRDPQLAQQGGDQRAGRHAVHVVVAKHADGLAPGDRPGQALHGLGQAVHLAARVLGRPQIGQPGRQEAPRRLDRAVAAPDEQPGSQRAERKRLRQGDFRREEMKPSGLESVDAAAVTGADAVEGSGEDVRIGAFRPRSGHTR